MRPLEKIYWLRLALGLFAALVCIVYGLVTGSITSDFSQGFVFGSFFNGTSIALIIYLFSYYIIKAKLGASVEKPQKIMTTGIGIYILSWIVFWVLLYTIIAGPISPPPA
jgi:hypothetical protein